MTTPREICVNLTAAEASAWASGADTLIRPAKVPTSRSGIVHLRDSVMYGTWSVGDVLILREAHVRTSVVEAGEELHSAVLFRADHPNSATSWDSAARLPKAIARHRYPVVSVRVCRGLDLTHDECRDAGWNPDGWVRSRLGPAPSIGGGIRSIGLKSVDEWVSVTKVNRSAT